MSGEKPNVVLKTSMGEITLELYWVHAPKTCKNFLELAKRGYYNEQIFHRVIPDFLVQGGDPTGTGRGGTSIYGATLYVYSRSSVGMRLLWLP
jgi:peptidyl-prolyl cis-trans isomerase-like 1